VRAAVEAQKQGAAGHDDKAVELLKKAIGFSPDYATAYTNLTTAYLRLGELDQAIATAQRAVDRGRGPAPGKANAADLSNLAYAQLLKGRFTEAAANSRSALDLVPEFDKAHLVLVGSLAAGGGDLHEAAQHLEFAARTLPAARRMLEAVRQRLAREAIPAAQSAQSEPRSAVSSQPADR
jgi:tetratricopeptide (TPR) repeat protein